MPSQSAELVKNIFGKMLSIPPAMGKPENFPFVKLIDKGWKVSVATASNEGYADFKKKIIHVPIDASPTSERTRFHELAHVKWTPGDTVPGQVCRDEKVPMAFLNSFEDCRVNHKLMETDPSFEQLLKDGRLNVNLPQALSELDRFGEYIDPVELQAVTSAMYVCSRGYGEADEIEQFADIVGIPKDEIDKMIESVTKPGATFEDTVAAAKALRDLIFGEDMPDPPEGDPGEGDGDEEGDEEGEGPSSGKGDGEEGEESSDGDDDADASESSDGDDADDSGDVRGDGEEGGKSEGSDAAKKEYDFDAIDWAARSIEIEEKPSSYKMYRKPPKPKSVPPPTGIKAGSEGTGLQTVKDGLEFGDRYGSPDGVEPGVMQILRPPLSVPITKKLHRPYVKKQDYEGGEIRQIQRLYTDGKIMRRKAPLRSRKRVGTLIIDVSGSMQVRVEQIEQILRSAPQVTVAVYGSNGLDRHLFEKYPPKDTTRTRREYTVGHLAIVAHKGKRISESEIKKYLGGGNVVDTEAVRWLASQPKPRFWICDGAITGKGDRISGTLARECVVTCKRAKIKRIGSVPEFLQLLEKTA